MARPHKFEQLLPSLWRILRRFSPHIREQSGLVTGSMTALLAEIFLRILEPWPLKIIFDQVILGVPESDTKLIFLADQNTETLLLICAVSLVLVIGLRAVVSYLNVVGFALVGNRVLTRVRGELYSHLQYLSLSFHNKAKVGDLVLRIVGDVGLLKEVAVTAMLPLFANILVLFGMVGVMLWLNWRLALVAIAIYPLFWLAALRLGGSIRRVSRQQRQRESAMAATAAESMQAIKVIQALSLEGIFQKTFSSQNAKSLNEGVKAKRLAANLERTVDVFIGISTALVVYYGARLVLSGGLTPGELLVFLFYLKAAFKPIRNFAKFTGRLAKASAAGDRLLDILDTVPEIRDQPDAMPAHAFRGVVSFRQVEFSYGDEAPVLRDIDFSIPAGELAAIVGPSGAGKSTVASLLARLYDPIAGQVCIDGVDIRSFTLASLRRQIGIVLQENILFAATVYDNIAYGWPGATRGAIEDAARLANAHEFISRLPDGYDTVLSEGGASLSNGQRQRIAIARAAVRRAPILVLDEPTSGLDRENEHIVTEALLRLAHERTTLLIAHNLKLAIHANQIFFLEDGQVLERGTHQQLMSANGRYTAMFTAQARRQSSVPGKRPGYVVST